jgi:triphosphatase
VNTEIELKLRMKPDELGRLRRHPALRALRLASSRTRKLHNVYFDTEDFALRKNRMALRVRHVGRQRIQTLKAPGAGASGAAHHYLEWESAIDGDQPVLAEIGDAAVRETLPDEAELRQAFVSDISRSTVPLVMRDSKIELALDTGEIATVNGSEQVCEAELELKSGRPARLYELALQLHEDVPFTVEYRSKAARGYDLLTGAQPGASKAAPLDLDADLGAWEAFVVIARQCLQHLRANEDCARLGKEPEGVHQLRVGIRRLRAAFSLFDAVLPEEHRHHFVEELRWAQQSFGPARDWDVFIGETLEPLSHRLPEQDTLARLMHAASEARDAAYRQATATLNERRYTRLQLQLDLWLESGADHGGGAIENPPWLQPVGAVAREVLAIRHRKLRKLAKNFPILSDDGRHRLRISAKKARYAAEFFRTLFPRKQAQKYARSLAEMQDCLGSMNDAVVGHALVEELTHDDDSFSRATDMLAGWHAARIAGDMPRAAEMSRKIAKIERFWETA